LRKAAEVKLNSEKPNGLITGSIMAIEFKYIANIPSFIELSLHKEQLLRKT
jgi:hypothetical protein